MGTVCGGGDVTSGGAQVVQARRRLRPRRLRGQAEGEPLGVEPGTVVIGAIVILFDPIFEGLAVALIAGSFASTILTLIVVPGVYYLVRRGPAGPPSTNEDLTESGAS